MDSSYDVIILGSGAGGLSAALTCRDAGLSVLVLEKTEYFGGSTAVSGGAVWIPDNPHMTGLGMSNGRAAATRYLQQTVGNYLRPEMIAAFLDHGPEMVRFMESKTEVHFIARPVSPDYEPELEGAARGGRTIDPAPLDGRRLGPYFALLRPPIPSFLALGGMMVNRKDIDALLGMLKSWSAFRHSTALVSRYARDRLRWRRGTRLVLGNALAARLLKSAIDAGVILRRRATVSRLVTEDGTVVGVALKGEARDEVLRARRAVVLATGGFPQSPELRAQLLPHAAVHRSMAPVGNTGDGASLASRLGAQLAQEKAGGAFWAPVSIMKDTEGRETVFPHLVTDRQKPGIVAVNAAGRRFVN
jgi:succinate dehydrogenase/fumarate reductase flavoprotein subunit